MAFQYHHAVLAWNLAFSFLVVLPLVTGGLWYRSEKIFIEYTQTGPAALLLGLILWYRVRRNPTSLHEGFLLRSVQRAWHKWEIFIAQHPSLAMLLSYIFVSLLWFFTSLRRHHAFSSGAADLGIFTNTIWNFSNGFGYISSVKGGINLLADHQSYFFFLLTPFFKLWPNAECLLLLQALGLASGGIALFLLGKQYLRKESPFLALLPILYWSFQPIRNANLFDFHPEIFQLPLFLFAIWGLQEKTWARRVWGSLFFLLALSTKESAGPVATGIGLAWLLGAGPESGRGFTKTCGIFAILFGIGIFLFNLKVVPPLFQSEYSYSAAYGELGPNISDLILSPLEKTGAFFSHIFGFTRLKFLFAVLAPFLFLPLFSWRAFIAALPGLLMLFLTDGTQRVSLGFHYAIEPSTGILWALAAALGSLRIEKQNFIFYGLVWAALIFYGRSEMFQIRRFEPTPYQSWVRTEALPKLSPLVTLAAPTAIVPHVANRHWAHFLPEIKLPNGALVDCLLIEPSVDNSPLDTASSYRLKQIADHDYEREFGCPNAKFEIYRNKNLTEKNCITAPIACPSPSVASSAEFR